MKRYKILIGLLVCSVQLFFLVPHILGAPAPMPSPSPAPTGAQPSPSPSPSPSSSSCPVFHPQSTMILIPGTARLVNTPGFNEIMAYDNIVDMLQGYLDVKPSSTIDETISVTGLYSNCYGSCLFFEPDYSSNPPPPGGVTPTDMTFCVNSDGSITKTEITHTTFLGPNHTTFTCNAITTTIWAYNQQTNELSVSKQSSWYGTCFAPIPPTGSSSILVNTVTGQILGTTSGP